MQWLFSGRYRWERDMYFRMKLITVNGKVREESKDTFKSFESVVNALSNLK